MPFKNKDDSELIFTKLEVLPCPKGDYNTWKRYVDSSLGKYKVFFPTSDSLNKIADSVTVKFIISRVGKLSDYKILSGNNLFLNSLAIDLLEHSGKWTPGDHSGRLVNSLRTFPMKFEIDYSSRSIKYLPSQKDYWKRND